MRRRRVMGVVVRVGMVVPVVVGVSMGMARAIGVHMLMRMFVFMRMVRFLTFDSDFAFTTTTGHTHRISPRFN
jgi:hypothetical protein